VDKEEEEEEEEDDVEEAANEVKELVSSQDIEHSVIVVAPRPVFLSGPARPPF